MNVILREAPAVEEIFHAGKDWGISLVVIKRRSKNIGLSIADITSEGDMDILAIDRAGTDLTRPNWGEKIIEGDRLLVYANRESVKRVLD